MRTALLGLIATACAAPGLDLSCLAQQRPPPAAECISLKPSLIRRFGCELSLKSTVRAAQAWALSLNRDELKVHVGEGCKLHVRSKPLDGALLATRRGNSITVDETSSDLWSCETARYDLGSVLMHELGHAFGAKHTKTGLMKAEHPRMCFTRVDEAAVQAVRSGESGATCLGLSRTLARE